MRFSIRNPQVCLVDTDHINVIKWSTGLPPFLHTGGKKPRNVASAPAGRVWDHASPHAP